MEMIALVIESRLNHYAIQQIQQIQRLSSPVKPYILSYKLLPIYYAHYPLIELADR